MTAVSANLNSSIITRLVQAVTDPVAHLTVHAPFHDADCAALEELIRAFDPEHVRVMVSGDTSIDPSALTRVLARARQTSIERVRVRDDPATYIHAKWIHLRHPDSTETLLSGSANLSRAALLHKAETANIEISVLTRAAGDSFGTLYDHLDRQPVDDPATLGLVYRGQAPIESPTPSHPILRWSALENRQLILVFDKPIPDGTAIDVNDSAKRPLQFDALDISDAIVSITLPAESWEQLTGGGPLTVRLAGDNSQRCTTWPYRIDELTSRLERAAEREHLPSIADLPDQDADLYQLLRDLEQTLLIDRTSVWRVAAGPGRVEESVPEPDADIRLDDLDWGRIRRDPRYTGYLHRNASHAAAPTDIQVILKAIADQLGGLGRDTAEVDLIDLAHEGTTISADVEDDEDEAEGRRLPIRTRTRMAFERFIRRYATALGDEDFVREMGPIPAVTNAVVFDNLLGQLLAKEYIRPERAIDAHLSTWGFLWGLDAAAPTWSTGDPEASQIIQERLHATQARRTTINNVAAAADRADTEVLPRLRQAVRSLLISPCFELDADLLIEATRDQRAALGLLTTLREVATLDAAAEVIPYILQPAGLAPGRAGWRTETVRRQRRGNTKVTALVIDDPIPDLTPEQAQRILERLAAGARDARLDTSYLRVRFSGNDHAVAFWDAAVREGVVLLGDEETLISDLKPRYPEWEARLVQLSEELSVERITDSA